ncbi:hypothetical protein MBLNU457_3284t1 [Dothideomycetes sp. NU457]
MDTRPDSKSGPGMLTPVAEDPYLQDSSILYIQDSSPLTVSHRADRNIRRYCPDDDRSIQEDLIPEALRLSPILFDDELHNDKLSTQTDLLRLPRNNPSFNVSYFLRTTGPDLPMPVPKPKKAKRNSPMPRGTFGMFKTKAPKNAVRPKPLIGNVEQKVSTTGKKYLQIVPSGEHVPVTSDDKAPLPSKCENAAAHDASQTKDGRDVAPDVQSLLPVGTAPHIRYVDNPPYPGLPLIAYSLDVFESRVSVLMYDIENSCNNASDPEPRGRKNQRAPSGQSVRIITEADRSPVRPSAADSPTLNQDSGIELPEEDRSKQSRSFRKLDASTPLSSNPRSPTLKPKESFTALPPVSQKPASRESYTIVQPSPRRAGSHPILLARASSDVSALCWSKKWVPELNRSSSDPPGPPPPPRSPLRMLPKDPPSIEDILAKTNADAAKTAENKTPEETGACSSFRAIGYHQLSDPSTLNRGNGSSASTTDGDAAAPSLGRRFTSHRRPRSKALPVIESVVHGPPPRPRRRLTRARPQGASSVELSRIRKRISLTQTQEEASRPTSVVITPATNTKPREANHSSVVPLTVAGAAPAFEAIPRPKPMRDRSSIAIPAKGRKSPGPRPRSAKMPNRSPRVPNTPPRSKSPPTRRVRYETEYTPEPPSPPPKRSLPPTPKRTPPRSAVSEPQTVTAEASSTHTVITASAHRPPPLTVLNTTFPAPPSSRHGSAPASAKDLPSPPASIRSIKPDQLEGLLTSLHGPKPLRTGSQGSGSDKQSVTGSKKENRSGSGVSTDLEARLRAVERRNQLLEATLITMIRNSNIAGMSAALCQMRGREDLDFDTDASAGAETDAFLGKDAVHTCSALRRDTSGGSKRSGSSHASRGSNHRRSDLDVLAHIGHPAFSRHGSEEFVRDMGSMPEEAEIVKSLERAAAIQGVDGDEMQRCSSGSSALDEYLNNRMPSFGEAVVGGR